MNGLKIVLLGVIAVLLLVFVVDRYREPQQLGALAKTLQEVAASSRAQTEELRAVRKALEARAVAMAPSSQQHAGAPAIPRVSVNDPSRDGKPVLGVNFLLPMDRSYINPAHMGGTFKAFGSSPKGLNPIIENEQMASAVQDLCNDSLCDRGPQAPELWRSLLAESVVISEDYKIYTFTLRRGVHWQRPLLAEQAEFSWMRETHELTAEDFVFALEVINDPKVDCGAIRGYYEDLDHAEAPDPYTLRLIWKKKVYTSLSFSLGLEPLPKHIYARNRDGSVIPPDQLGVLFNKHWFDAERGVCGVGAFMMTEFVPDKVIRFRRNPDYWTTPPQHNEAIEWNLEVKKDDAQLVAFKNGQVSTFGLAPLTFKSEVIDHKEPRFAAIDPAQPKAGRSGELGWEKTKRLAFSYIGWNCRRPLFSDQRVRQAMSYAFPKERLIRDVFMGLGTPIMSDVHPDSASYNRSLKPYLFEATKAAALLAEAGWKDSDSDGLLDKVINGNKVDFRFEVRYYANSAEWDNSLAIYRSTLKPLGIELTPKPYEWKELVRVYEDRDFDAVVGTWGMDWDVDFYQLWNSTQIDTPNGSNHCGFSHPRVDQLSIELRETFEADKRAAIINEVQAIIHEAQPYTFFLSPESIFTWQNKAPLGSTVKDRYLDGVIRGLDELNPLRARTPIYWHFPQ